MKPLTSTQEHIAVRAYYLFLEGGCQHGKDQEYWYQAEKELGAKFFTPPDAEDTPASAPPAAKKAAKKAATPEKAPAAKKAAAKKAPAKKAAKK